MRGNPAMWRDRWIKILIALQVVNLLAMCLFEQQRRTLWNKETAGAQKLTDAKFFTEKTEADLQSIRLYMKDVQERLILLQIESEKNANNAALIKDANQRIQAIELSLKNPQATRQP
jgi:hypothetical protein